MKTKTASVRLPKEMYEEIDNICDDVGCSRNDWIKDKLKEALREESNENGLDQEENTPRPNRNPAPKEEPKPKVEEIPELKNPRIIETNFNPDDYEIKSEPKPTIKEITQNNSNKPEVKFTSFNGKLLPFAKRYNL